MALLVLYFIFLFIAPQLWVGPLVGVRVDFFLYPAWIMYCLFTGRFGQIFRLDGQDRFFLLMLVWMVLSMALKGWTNDSPMIVQNYFKWFLLYRLVVVTIGDVGRMRKVGVMLLCFASVLAVEGIQHMNSPDGLGWAGQTFGWVDGSAAEIGLDKRTRWIAIFDGPGVFCVVYTIALPFALSFSMAPFGKVTRIMGMALVTLLLVGIYYTGARGGYLTAIAVIGLFFALKSGVSAKRLLLGGVLGGAILMLAPGYVTSTRDSHGSAQHRVDMWAKGLEMVTNNPVMGIGKGNFKYYTGSLIAHNSVIETMGETGFVGLFLWIGIIYMGIKKLLVFQSLPAIDPFDRACVSAVGLSIVGYLVSAMFVTLEYETFYLLLAMSAVAGRGLPHPVRFTSTDAFVMGGLMVLFAIFLKFFVMMYY